jgi:hypothetical protein
MIQAISNQSFAAQGRPPDPMLAGKVDDFAEFFGDATRAVPKPAVSVPAVPVPAASVSAASASAAQTSLGDPDVQGWLTSFYTEYGNASAANISYQAAPGAGANFPTGSVFGPDAIFSQALANQDGNAFATMAGDSPASFTSQLPGIPTQAAQQEFDRRLSLENLERLQSGQPIDTTAYWSDPGPITTGGVTYTSQELGYAGPGQSSGPQPIYISSTGQVPGTDSYSVPGYTGTVTGIQPDRYYTMAQLEQAGLQSGQPDAQFHPGSWTLTESS